MLRVDHQLTAQQSAGITEGAEEKTDDRERREVSQTLFQPLAFLVASNGVFIQL